MQVIAGAVPSLLCSAVSHKCVKQLKFNITEPLPLWLRSSPFLAGWGLAVAHPPPPNAEAQHLWSRRTNKQPGV